MDEGPANEAVEPEGVSGATPPRPPGNPPGWVLPANTSGQPNAGRRRRPTSLPVLAVAWVIAVALVALRSRFVTGGSGGDSAYEAGRAVGTLVGPILIALVVRWVFVRFRGGPILRSGWVPLLAIALSVLSLFSAVAARMPVDPETAMHIAAPYRLTTADAATVDQVLIGIRQEDPQGRAAVRLVEGSDGSSSLLFATDGRLAPGDIAEVARGMASASGLQASVQTIAGTDVAIAIGDQAALGSWIDPPLLISVVAGDEPTLRAVIEAWLAVP